MSSSSSPEPDQALPAEPIGNIFVAGLAPTMNDASFRALFEPYGRILSAKVMVDLHTGQSRCFGFILFERFASAAAAKAALHRQQLLGASTALFIDFSTQHPTQHLLQKSCSIFVRNIPKSTSKKAIKRHFERFGEVRTVDILPDTAVGASGTCIVAKVNFNDADVAAEAETQTQCSKNVFADALGHRSAPPLLAKLAENRNSRLRRLGKPPRRARANARLRDGQREQVYAADNQQHDDTSSQTETPRDEQLDHTPPLTVRLPGMPPTGACSAPPALSAPWPSQPTWLMSVPSSTLPLQLQHGPQLAPTPIIFISAYPFAAPPPTAPYTTTGVLVACA